jgi:hypothetical protein
MRQSSRAKVGGPMRQSLWSIAPYLSVNLCDAFLIPVRGVRRPARTKASAPPRYSSLGACAAPRPPRLPRFAAQAGKRGKAASVILRSLQNDQGSRGIIPLAVGDGPKPGSEGGCAARPRPTCGAWGAGVFGAPQQACRTRKLTTARQTSPPAAPLPRPLQAATELTDRRRRPVLARMRGELR